MPPTICIMRAYALIYYWCLRLDMADETCPSCEHECAILSYECPIFGGLVETDMLYCYNCEVGV
jgi:hypothetical protein